MFTFTFSTVKGCIHPHTLTMMLTFTFTFSYNVHCSLFTFTLLLVIMFTVHCSLSLFIMIFTFTFSTMKGCFHPHPLTVMLTHRTIPCGRIFSSTSTSAAVPSSDFPFNFWPSAQSVESRGITLSARPSQPGCE